MTNSIYPIYCVYITICSNPSLPMFYIGSSNVFKVQSENYHGSVSSKKYKSIWIEIINSKKDLSTHILSVHETRNEALDAERELQLEYDVARSNIFINRAIVNLNNKWGYSQEGIPKTGGAAKGVPKTGKRAKGMPNLGKVAKGVPNIGKSAKGMPNTGGKAKGVPNTGKSAKGLPNTGKNAKGSTQIIVLCPHCSKSGGISLMTRYHFNNCKKNVKGTKLIVPF